MRSLKILFFTLVLGSFVIYGCQEGKKEQLIQKIEQKEQTLSTITEKKPLSKKEVNIMLTLYEKFYNEYSDDSLSAIYIMNAGQNALHSQMYQKATSYYGIIETNFANTSHYPMAVFMKAFVFDQANDTARARIYYNKFISEFPDHKLADDAQISLNNLGKSLKEIVDSFDKKMQPE